MKAMMQILNGRRAVRCGFVIGLVLITGPRRLRRPAPARADGQDIQKLNRFVQTTKADTPALKMFREGRDLIEAESWPQAAAKFDDFVRGYPKDKDVDAALYWFAYALKKQNKKEEAARPLLRLIKDFRGSSWRQEAEAMLVELGYGNAIQDALKRDDVEIKILALQSLFEADEERAYAFVADLLKPGSNPDPTLRAAAVSLLGSHGGPRAVPILLDIARNPQTDLKLRLTAIKRLGEQNNEAVVDGLAQLYDAERTPELKRQLLRAFSEMHTPRAEAKLVEAARTSDDLELRRLAIRYLGERDGAASLDELIRLLDTERTPEIRSQLLRALSERDDPRARAKLLDVARRGETPELRVEAIRRLGDRGSAAVEDLLQLYASESNESIKQGLLRAYAETDDPRARAKLFEVARGADKLELRMFALRRLGEHDDAQTIEQLVQLYDGEQNVQVKATLIRTYGESHQKVALRKLMAIARADQNVELRKQAVRSLGESKDPEALKFLEDLLK